MIDIIKEDKVLFLKNSIVLIKILCKIKNKKVNKVF